MSDRLSVRLSPQAGAVLDGVQDRRAVVEHLLIDYELRVASSITHLADLLGGVGYVADSVRWLRRLDTAGLEDAARLHPDLDRTSHEVMVWIVEQSRINSRVVRALGGE